MTQRYSLIFWKRQMKNADTLSLAKIVYEILKKLVSYNDVLYPRYITSRSKTKVKEFILGEETIRTLVDQSLKKERKYSPNLGATIAFFTSLDDEKSAKISFSVGYDSPILDNSIVINLPVTMRDLIDENTERLYVLFQDITKVFQPYYAFVANSLNNHISDDYWVDKPCYVHWINYFSNATIELIGVEKFCNLNCTTTVEDGIYLRLQNNLFDVADVEALERQANATRILGL